MERVIDVGQCDACIAGLAGCCTMFAALDTQAATSTSHAVTNATGLGQTLSTKRTMPPCTDGYTFAVRDEVGGCTFCGIAVASSAVTIAVGKE